MKLLLELTPSQTDATIGIKIQITAILLGDLYPGNWFTNPRNLFTRDARKSVTDRVWVILEVISGMDPML